MRISFELPEGFIVGLNTVVSMTNTEGHPIKERLSDMPGFKMENVSSAPCALLCPSFVLKALAVVAQPSVVKELV